MINECNVVQDMLPLCVEGMASADTEQFVWKHLAGCPVCSARLRQMEEASPWESGYQEEDPEDPLAVLKLLNRKLKRRRLLTILISVASAVAIVLCVLYTCVLSGVPVSSEPFVMETEFQAAENAYLGQRFVLHITRTDGLPLSIGLKKKYERNEVGEKVWVGYEIRPKRYLLNLMPDPDNFTIAYDYPAGEGPEEGFDFTIAVRFTDKTVVYSMTEEGLFLPQDNLVDHFAER